MAYENSRQRRKREAEQHNKLRAEQLALELDKKSNPEKYKRKRRVRQSTAATAFIATAMAISPNAFSERLLKQEMTVNTSFKSITEKKRKFCESLGQEVVGYVMKSKTNSYQIICDGRVISITEQQYRDLMLYPSE